MSVAFNLEEDSRFNDSLEFLPISLAHDVVATLKMIQDAQISWAQFVTIYNWTLHPIVGSDTYPGANELHSFQITVDDLGTEVEIVGYTYENRVVVCSVARLA